MRERSLFNNDWLFAADRLDFNAPDAHFEPVNLPHTNKIFPHSNVDSRQYQCLSTYRKQFHFSPRQEDERLFLEFDGVMSACQVFLNDKLIAEHAGGFRPFSMDITEALQAGVNVLTVYVDSTERPDIPPFGHLVDYLTFGGIYRDVHLTRVKSTHIQNIHIITSSVLENPGLACQVQVSSLSPHLTLRAALREAAGRTLAEVTGRLAGGTTRLTFGSLPPVALWSLDQPSLYTLHLRLEQDGVVLDELASRFGFRSARFMPDGRFLLNGEHIPLRGLNRHQTYPFIGAAAPARLQRLDADLLKYELGCNLVRTSHYPQSPHFLDRCDEIGLLVFEEIPGWQHIGDEKWKQAALADLRSMIERDRHHPAIILWGVRINESPDDDDFYTRTNALAHQLDPSRQTGGVRCFRESHFLEDVFTYNDFSNTVLAPVHQPCLITEFGGHMFPAKTWDHEQRLIDHALLHARVQDLARGQPGIAGAIGWCAFDYATHIEFGSGDRICYHGVMDIFRLPKWAAFFYKSQLPPEKQVVLQAATHWTMGDRSGGGFNPLTVFSNCEEIEVWIGDMNAGRFQPDRLTYPHLEHPPFTVTGLDQYSAWGQRQFHDLHLIGYIQGKPVARQRIPSSRLPTRLELRTDTPQLQADGADMTRLIFRLTDDCGNPLPYAAAVVSFELEGEADLIGENPYPLMGGQAALFLKARRQPGRVVVHAITPRLPGADLELEIIPPPHG